MFLSALHLLNYKRDARTRTNVHICQERILPCTVTSSIKLLVHSDILRFKIRTGAKQIQNSVDTQDHSPQKDHFRMKSSKSVSGTHGKSGRCTDSSDSSSPWLKSHASTPPRLEGKRIWKIGQESNDRDDTEERESSSKEFNLPDPDPNVDSKFNRLFEVSVCQLKHSFVIDVFVSYNFTFTNQRD